MLVSKTQLQEFYSNVGRLIKLIDVAIEKRQRKNAEEYLEYFFHTAVRYYEKGIEPDSDRNDELPLYQEESDNKRIGQRFLNESARRRTLEFGRDYFANAVLELIRKSVDEGNYEIYRRI